MFSLDGDFRKRFQDLPELCKPGITLSDSDKDILFYVTCFQLADKKFSRQQIDERVQEVTEKVLDFYMGFKKPIDSFCKAKLAEYESPFFIAEKIFKIMKKKSQTSEEGAIEVATKGQLKS